jgi:hypothetical protein
MKLELVFVLQKLIVAFIAYILTITVAGWFEAFVAKQMGDDAPQEAGFLTLNPLQHFSIIGFAALLWSVSYKDALPFKFLPGWGRHIPLIPDNIHGSDYKIRIFIEYISRSIAHLLLLMGSVAALVAFCDVALLHGILFYLTPDLTSFKHSIAFLLLFLTEQNLLLFVIHFCIGLFKYALYFYMPNQQEITLGTMFLGFVALFLMMIFFGPFLEMIAMGLINYVQTFVLMLKKSVVS